MMKKAFIIAQWLIVAFLFVTLVNFFIRKDPLPDTEWGDDVGWDGFFALSFEGIADSDNPRYVSPAKLDAFLDALKDHGYSTINTDDIESFYYRDAPLPRKAVLLMFEGGRKDHMVWATPRLIKHRMTGTLFVPTEVTEYWGNHFIDKTDLRRITRHPNWSLASMGHEAIKRIAVDPAGKEGNFLSRRAWVRNNVETDGMFEDRLTRDYRVAADILARATSRPIQAYLYPYGDPGEGRDVDPLASTINQGALKQFHRIAFTQEGSPFNGQTADPYALTRMRVQGVWSPEDLLRALEEWYPASGLQTGWYIGNGVMDGDSILLGANGSALLRGSDFWGDFEAGVTMRISTGTVAALYVRYAGPHAFLRVSIQNQTVRLQEKRLGKLQTLASTTRTNNLDDTHHIFLRIKNNRIWVSHDQEMFARSVPISRQFTHGQFWIGSEGGEIQVQPVHYLPLKPLFLLDGRYHQLSDAMREQASALLPVWLDVDRLHPLSEHRQVEVMRAARDGINTVPVITTHRKYTRADAHELAKRVAAIFNMPSVRMLVTRFAVTGYDPELAAAFRDLGYQVTFIVSVDEAMELLKQQVRIGTNEMLLIAGDEGQVEMSLEEARKYTPARRLAVTTRQIELFPPGVTRVIYADHR
ncbi:MAG TPA: polysaccharide deacetylase family protein [Kiritimatiellia bacterium]|nr:polysaccharide deacetylase family protein [Kiritimatiellia bacterium]